MRVLHVIPSVSAQSGGPAHAIFPMCRALQAHGVEITLATTNSELESSQKDYGKAVDYKGVSTIFFPAQWGSSFKFSRPMSIWFNENISTFDLVHIHAVFNHSCLAAARACRKQGVPYVVRPLGTLDPWSMGRKRLIKSAFWQLTGKRMLTGAAAVHYTTEAEKDAVENSLKLNHGAVVPLGIDMDVNGLAVHIEASPMDSPYVLVMSRLHPKKGLDVLIDAFSKLVSSPEFAHWRLVLAGDGPSDYVELLKRQASSGLKANFVTFPGWLSGENKMRFLRNASLLALPSYQENFGLCVLEALSCSVPVLISPHVNLADTIEASGAGWIVDVERDAIARSLVEALGSQSELAKRGLAGVELSKRFTWGHVAEELLSLYQRINGIPGPSGEAV